MYKLLVISRSEGNVAQSILEFNDRGAAAGAEQRIRDFDVELKGWTVKVVRLYGDQSR